MKKAFEGLTFEDVSFMASAYCQEVGYTPLAEMFGLSPLHIWHILKEIGVESRPTTWRRREKTLTEHIGLGVL